ncbi:bifunctional diguanylate cyclase/phosphodiesterase [Pseudalkalibacillus decolorationis]|uniref:bifunctional diguanylate cyclase/phosphodiesterase n=1 Tax=Pseudalkalibacillus decolorationis TaxID=163879 RepID=UPI0021476AEC|nr:EAL domain-containing protein [Pseudalkalibacillus decolorationis]
MRTYSTIYRNTKQLQLFIEENNLLSVRCLLIQIFTMDSRVRISRLLTFLNKGLPNATIIGASVDASVCDELIVKGTVLSFTVFEKSTLIGTTVSTEQLQSNCEIDNHLSTKFVRKDTKAIVLFGDIHSLESCGLLESLEESCPDVLITGGNSVAVNENKNGFLISNEGVIDSGIVAVSMNGPELRVSMQKSSEWTAAGRAFTVTSSKKTRVLTLENSPVRDVYEKYLGKKLPTTLTGTSCPFPLMVKREGKLKPMMVEKFLPDGSITTPESIEEGETVYIGYGDAGIFLNSGQFIKDSLRGVPVETVFMYSCLTRRRFFKHGIEVEVKSLQQLIPTVGAFTAGEYYHGGGRNEVLSYALTFLTIAEEDVYIQDSTFDNLSIEPYDFQELLALSQLIKTSTEELEAVNQSLKESEQRYKSLFDHNPDVVYAMDMDGYITSVNETLTKVLGFDMDQVVGKNALAFVVSEEKARVAHYFEKALQNKPQHYSTLIHDRNCEKILFDIANIPMKVNGQVVGVFGIAKDITAQDNAEKKIAHLAYHDALTGLPNRLYFHNRLNASLKKAAENNEQLAVMFVDLDEFKMINDSLGHQAGDKILKHVAKNLSNLIRNELFLARFAADEFLILVPCVMKIDIINRLAKNVLNVLRKPIYLNGKDYAVSGSIGISFYPSDAHNGDLLLKNANLAMHRAKLTGRNSVQFYTSDMNDTIVERLELENHLRKAMELNELEVFYQPQINLTDGNVFACEALLRWNHTKRGMIPPNQFIPIAEEAGLIIEIGRWVLNQACNQAKYWHEQGMDHLSICVNVSGVQFQRRGFIEEVEEALHKSGLNANALHIEITESIMLENAQVIDELRKLGVKISVDDFGTGYSSLSYLKDFPIDILKIDQSFIRNLEEKSSDAAIVKAIITMCEGLGVTVLAEGVETEQQLKTLKKFGCNQIQGYYISKPVVPAAIEQFLLNENAI